LTNETQNTKGSTSAVSWAVFAGTVTIVLITLTSVVFPALVVRSISSITDSQIDPWETGVWATPMIATNLIILAIGIAYFKNKLPSLIKKSIQFVFDFEISKKVAFIAMIILLAVYITASAQEIASEEVVGDYSEVKRRVTNWNIDQVDQEFEPHVRYFFLSSSLALFDNIRVIPFIASIALLVLTYFITLELSQKRFAGLVAMTLVLQSNVFLTYDTTSTFENIWILLYLLSLYLIYKSWPLSPVSYIFSIFAKALTAIFLPMTLFFIYRAKVSRKKKISTSFSYLVVFVIGVSVFVVFDANLAGPAVGFSNFAFWQGFTSMAFQLRFDVIVLLFLLPLTVGLFLAARRDIIQADSIMVLISGILLSAPFLTGFTDITNQPYRFVPLVVFFAMGVGVILSKRKPNLIQ